VALDDFGARASFGALNSFAPTVLVENSVSSKCPRTRGVEGTNSPRFCWQRRDTGLSRAKQWRMVVSSAREHP